MRLLSEFARVNDGDGLGSGSTARTETLNQLSDVLAFKDLTKHNVLAVQPRSLDRGDEELGTIGVGAGIRHGQNVRAGVLELEVFVGELGAVDRLSSATVSISEVSSLKHEVGDDAVESGSLVVQRLALLADTLLAGAQGAEVFNGLGHDVSVEAHDDAAELLAISFDVKEDLVRHGGTGRDHGEEGGTDSEKELHLEGVRSCYDE